MRNLVAIDKIIFVSARCSGRLTRRSCSLVRHEAKQTVREAGKLIFSTPFSDNPIADIPLSQLYGLWLTHFQTPRIDLRKIGNGRMKPTVAMRDLMAAYHFGGESKPSDKLIGRKINIAKRRAAFVRTRSGR
jgi:hypothetical protein